MAKRSKKRVYQVVHPGEHLPDWVLRAGNGYHICGIILDDGSDLKEPPVLVLLPGNDHVLEKMDHVFHEAGNYAGAAASVQHTDLALMSVLIRRLDDPLVFERDKTGNVKVIQRKAARALSGRAQQLVWSRDSFEGLPTCLYCGRVMGEATMTVDHFQPLELGGQDDIRNYVTACAPCNREKGSREPREYCGSEGISVFEIVAHVQGTESEVYLSHLGVYGGTGSFRGADLLKAYGL